MGEFVTASRLLPANVMVEADRVLGESQEISVASVARSTTGTETAVRLARTILTTRMTVPATTLFAVADEEAGREGHELERDDRHRDGRRPDTNHHRTEGDDECQVTVGGDTFDLPDPFFVIATQNPVEIEGAFPLPETDRFIIKTCLGYPDLDGEVELLSRRAGRAEYSPSGERIIGGADDVAALQSTPEAVTVDEDFLEYIAAISRRPCDHQHVEVGVSPRGTQRLFEAARAHVAIAGREFVTP